MDSIVATGLFSFIVLTVLIALGAAAIVGGLLYVWSFYLHLRDDPDPKRAERKRMRAFYRARRRKGIIVADPYLDPHPDAHGDGAWVTRQAAYPEGR